eukprot:1158892-Pelagomonas_calceolata.AAC.21
MMVLRTSGAALAAQACWACVHLDGHHPQKPAHLESASHLVDPLWQRRTEEQCLALFGREAAEHGAAHGGFKTDMAERHCRAGVLMVGAHRACTSMQGSARGTSVSRT